MERFCDTRVWILVSFCYNREIMKHQHLTRFEFFAALIFFAASVALLIDELYREGYLFRFTDIFLPRFTHEKFVVMFFGGGLYFYLRSRKKSHVLS